MSTGTSMRAFRIEPEKWKQFQDVAKETDERTASQQLRYLIDQYLAQSLPLAPNQPSEPPKAGAAK